MRGGGGEVVFTPSFGPRFWHTIVAAWMVGCSLVMSVAAYYLLRRRHEDLAKTMMRVALPLFTVLAIHHQISPPTINIFNQDPECDLDYCANKARPMKIDIALKNNFGFGGTNGSLVFKRV
mgnify:CR=1 FL=1